MNAALLPPSASCPDLVQLTGDAYGLDDLDVDDLDVDDLDVDDYGCYDSDDASPPSMERLSSHESDYSTHPETPSSTKSMKKVVSFGNLEELSFAVEKGDPSVFEMAYPMQLSSNVLEHASFRSIDDYEAQREGTPRRSNELKTSNSEERRQIIKQSKKILKEVQRSNSSGHRRRTSIGNGQISRLGALFGINNTSTEPPTPVVPPPPQVQSERLPPPPAPRPTLRRQNSIGNGQISRDKRRNRVQEFLKRVSNVTLSSSPPTN